MTLAMCTQTSNVASAVRTAILLKAKIAELEAELKQVESQIRGAAVEMGLSADYSPVRIETRDGVCSIAYVQPKLAVVGRFTMPIVRGSLPGRLAEGIFCDDTSVAFRKDALPFVESLIPKDLRHLDGRIEVKPSTPRITLPR